MQAVQAAKLAKAEVEAKLNELNLYKRTNDEIELTNRLNVTRNLLLKLLDHDQIEEFEEVVCQSTAAGIDIFNGSLDHNNLLKIAYEKNAFQCIQCLYRAGHPIISPHNVSILIKPLSGGTIPNISNISLLIYYGQTDDTDVHISFAVHHFLKCILLGYEELSTKAEYGKIVAAYTTKVPEFFNNSIDEKQATKEQQIAQGILDSTRHFLMFGNIWGHTLFRNPNTQLATFVYLFDDVENSFGGTAPKYKRGKMLHGGIDYSTDGNAGFYSPKQYLEQHLKEDEKPRAQQLFKHLKEFVDYKPEIRQLIARHRALAQHEVEFASKACQRIRENPSHKYADKKDEMEQKKAFRMAVNKVRAVLAAAAKAHEINYRDNFAAMSEEDIHQEIRNSQIAVKQGAQTSLVSVYQVLNQPRKVEKPKNDGTDLGSSSDSAVDDSEEEKLISPQKPVTSTAQALVKRFPIAADKSKRELFTLPTCTFASSAATKPHQSY